MNTLEKIKKLQREHKLNNAQLARKAELPQTTLQGLYKRNNQPTIPTLNALCKAFGITLAQFFADSNLPPDLTQEQTRLLEKWGPLNAEQKNVIFDLINLFH